jgi:enoyl-CoA hydratase
MAELVVLEVVDGIGTIRLNRPPVNALNLQLLAELADIAYQVDLDPSIYAVVIHGGPKAFAGGADIKEMAELSQSEAARVLPAISLSLSAVAAIRKPVVAAVTGYALGGGLELALTADYRIAGDNVKVGQPEIALGIIPGAGGTQRLTRLIGASKAKDLVFTGRYVKAPEALELGIVDKVVAPDDVYAESLAWAKQFVGGPSQAYAAAKAAIDGGLDGDLNSGLKLEVQLFTALFATSDQKEGMRSFIDNGPGKANFSGK